jgi:hypothetical protein
MVCPDRRTARMGHPSSPMPANAAWPESEAGSRLVVVTLPARPHPYQRSAHRLVSPGWHLRPGRTMYRWRPLETATNRWAPMACGPNVDHEAARDEEGLLVKHHASPADSLRDASWLEPAAEAALPVQEDAAASASLG